MMLAHLKPIACMRTVCNRVGAEHCCFSLGRFSRRVTPCKVWQKSSLNTSACKVSANLHPELSIPSFAKSFRDKRVMYKIAPNPQATALLDLPPYDDPVEFLNSFKDRLPWLPLSSSDVAAQTEDIAYILQCLTELHYQKLCKEFEWLQEIKIVALLQIQRNNLFDKSFGPVLEHSVFCELLNHIEQTPALIDRAEPQYLIHFLSTLLLLGARKDRQLFADLLNACFKQISGFDVEMLAKFQSVLRLLPRAVGLHCLSSSVSRYKEILQSLPVDCSTEDLINAIVIFQNFGHFDYISPELYRESAVFFSKAGHRFLSSEHLDLDMISSLCFIGRRLFTSPRNDGSSTELLEVRSMLLGLVREAGEQSLRVLDLCTARHLMDIVNSLRPLKLYTHKFMVPFERRAVAILSTTDRLSDVSSLYIVMSLNTPAPVMEKFERAIFDKLPQADPMTLVSLSFSVTGCKNQRFIDRYLEKNIQVAKTSNGLQIFRVFHLNSLIAISQSPSVNKKRRAAIHSIVDDCFKAFVFPSRQLYPLSSTYMFLKLIMDRSLPSDIYHEFLQSLPARNWKKIFPVMNLVRHMQLRDHSSCPRLKTMMTEMHNQLSSLLTQNSNLLPLVEDVTQVLHTVNLWSVDKDYILPDQLVSSYINLEGSLNARNVSGICSALTKLGYYHGNVLDMLARFVAHDTEDLRGPKIQLLQLCSKVGHVPGHLDEIQNKLLPLLDQDMEHNPSCMLQTLRVLVCLAECGSFPEAELRKVFSLGYLKKLDEYIHSHPEKKLKLEQALMELNRMVVLDCPQLDIPWFLEDYCQQRSVTDASLPQIHAQRKQVDDVSSWLPKVLGSSQHFKQATWSPYYYPIDVECWLDRSHKPLTRHEASQMKPTELQRVAILSLSPGAYCYNSDRLKGRESIRQRHLAKLGYKVIQVPYFTWQSLDKEDSRAKRDFLGNAIFIQAE